VSERGAVPPSVQAGPRRAADVKAAGRSPSGLLSGSCCRDRCSPCTWAEGWDSEELPAGAESPDSSSLWPRAPRRFGLEHCRKRDEGQASSLAPVLLMESMTSTAGRQLLVTSALPRATTCAGPLAEPSVGAILPSQRGALPASEPFEPTSHPPLRATELHSTLLSHSAEARDAAQGGGGRRPSSRTRLLAGKAPVSPASTVAAELPVAITGQGMTALGRPPVRVRFDGNRLQRRRLRTRGWKRDLGTRQARGPSNHPAGRKENRWGMWRRRCCALTTLSRLLR